MERAVTEVAGVTGVQTFLSSQRAVIHYRPEATGPAEIRGALEGAGYPAADAGDASPPPFSLDGFSRRAMTLFGVVFGFVLLVVVAGEGLGLIEAVTRRVPWPLCALAIIAGGWSIFAGVLRNLLKGRITSHALMTLGVAAAVIVGEWAAAVIVVFFMRVGDYVESFTAERARKAVRDLSALAPQTARVERGDAEVEVPVEEVEPGEIVIVRPGEKIPVDGEVLHGQATVNQATITGEAMPVETGPGAKVFAATLAQFGSLRVRAEKIGEETTFGKVIRLVQEAEANRADVQRFADRFSGYYLPIVAAVAFLTWLVGRDPLATAAVLVVVCSCSIALATPMAMIASIGAGARRGILIKGGRYLEALTRADVLLLDKTGTLTLGRPQLTDIRPFGSVSSGEVLALAATAERYSEHPLAEAVRAAARERQIPLGEPERFEAIPGLGVRAWVEGKCIEVGNRRLFGPRDASPMAALESEGKTALLVLRDGELIGLLAAVDTLRPEVPAALAEIRSLGMPIIELLTGDNERVATPQAHRLGITCRAGLLPEDKIAVVREHQARGKVVIMIGDGVNDAPALAQADIGIAMGAAGADIAIEAAHIALMREDWNLVPELLKDARRTMAVVKLNLVFTAIYNVTGLTFASVGLLPLTVAAALQSLPDIGILLNSSRLLRPRNRISR